MPGFGDPHARVLVLGLAPAAHGANRTGRVFTGDGSGDFLMSALHRAGFANIPTSQRPDDGLRLTDAYIAAAVRCAPPDNKPLPEEIAACSVHLDSEIAALRRLRVVVALGKIAWDAWFQYVARHGRVVRPRPPFGHGNVVTFPAERGGGASAPPNRQVSGGTLVPPLPGLLIGCFHPSRQNTNTGKVTAMMYDDIFARVKDSLVAR